MERMFTDFCTPSRIGRLCQGNGLEKPGKPPPLFIQCIMIEGVEVCFRMKLYHVK